MSTLRELASTEIRGIFHRHVSVFGPDDLASKILGELKETERYEAVITSGDKVGLVTIRDLLDVEQPERTKVERVWRVTGAASPDDTVIQVAEIMVRDSIRALPVVERGEVLGCVSQVEMTHALCDVDELSNVPVKGIMRHPVVAIGPDERIAQARRIMLEGGFSHIPIVEGGRLLGVLTAEDIVHTFITPASKTTRGDVVGERGERFPGAVAGIADLHPFTVGPDASALTVAQGLRAHGKSACIVTGPGMEVLGIITPRELMAPLLGLRMEEELPVSILGLSEEDFFERSVAEEKVRRVLRRGMRLHPHMQEASIRIERSNVQGSRTRYEVRARVLSPREQLVAEAAGWDLLAVFDALCDRLEKGLTRTKHEPPKVRARRTSPRQGRMRPGGAATP